MSTPSEAASTPRVTVNGEERRLPEAGAALTDLLRQLDFDPKQSSIAVAVEGEVVRREDWSEHTLAGGEAVEIITAQQGG